MSNSLSAQASAGGDQRSAWLAWVERVSSPVLGALGRKQLRAVMPVEAAPGHEAERKTPSPLEAMGRLFSGLAPWLELEEAAPVESQEQDLRKRFVALAQTGLSSGIDPASPDYMRFGDSGQTLVDAAFLSLALLRAPRTLLGCLDTQGRNHLAAALREVRKVQPPYSNWLLFAALNEVLLRKMGLDWDRMRVDYALRSHQAWYLGDGTYGDGPTLHHDYYNSYVIQPFLLAIQDELKEEPSFKVQLENVSERARRYAVVQERMISPSGEFPPIGRSITYRAGAFHLLADVARRSMLPATLPPSSIRAALAAVQERTLGARDTFTREGWLQIGLAGHQPGLGETYISTGSLYLCSEVWLPLGLSPAHPFWAHPAQAWTQKRIWSGENALADHSL